MSISERDFLRLLPNALADYSYEREATHVNVKVESGEIVIRWVTMADRKIASLVLPVLHVVFQIKNVGKNTTSQFFLDFDRAYQRGGG